MKRIIRPKKIILIILSITFIFIFSTGSHFFKKSKARILLIGIDGASWRVMTPLIGRSKLPHFKQLMDNGSWGKLQSFYPLISEVCWTSIATGKSLDSHGITDSLMEDPDTGELVPLTTNLIKVRTIWNILSEYKKKVGVIGYRMSWPPEKVNGVMVSDRIDKNYYLSKDYSYPPFKDLCSEKEYYGFFNIKNSVFSRIEEDGFPILNRDMEEEDNFKTKLSKYLLQRQHFDFFSLYFRGPDALSHRFWKYLFPKGFKIDEEKTKRYKDIINDYYIYCDNAIGDLLKNIDKDTIVIIVSDHGFGENLRARKGYYFLGFNDILKLCGLSEFRKGSKKIHIKQTSGRVSKLERYLRIEGDISENELWEIRKDAQEILKNIKLKETGYSIFDILRDTKGGFVVKINYPYFKNHPEYHILINGKEYKILDFLMPGPFCGAHATEAIIIISGKNTCQKKIIESATIYDIAPTILYLLGLPVAKDMKGKVLLEAIDNDFLRRHPVRYIDTYETGKNKKTEKPIRSLQDEEKIKQRMRSLGYIN